MVSVELISSISQIITWILSLLTLITFIYGVISWCLIRKFRSFTNHVILSAIFASLLRFLAAHVMSFAMFYVHTDSIVFVLINAVVLFFALAFHCWVAVVCYILYVDYVKVFHLNINGKYIITNVFAWCISFVKITGIFITYTFLGRELFFKLSSIFVFLVPTVVSVVNYIAALFCVFFGRKTEVWTSEQKLGHFAISTLIFLVNNSFVAVQICKAFIEGEPLLYFMIGVATEYLISLLVCVYFVCVKSNRTVWGEFLNKTPPVQTSMAMS